VGFQEEGGKKKRHVVKTAVLNRLLWGGIPFSLVEKKLIEMGGKEVGRRVTTKL